MRSAARWLIPVLSICAALALSVWAYRFAGQAWDAVVEYKSPYVELKLPASTAGEPVAERVVLVVIDGLRRDAAAGMPSLTALRGYGADFTLAAPQPSLSYPNWTTIVSGTTQDYHGVVTNWHEGAAPVETLFDTAKREGVPYVVVGPSDIATLFPSAAQADGSFFREWSGDYLSGTYVDQTLALSKRVKPRFVFLHLPDVDEAGHDFGGGSTEYAQTVARVDSDLRRLIEGFQDGRTSFVVVADHGHIDTGGHGGWEQDVIRVPGVFAGTGIHMAKGEAGLQDVAPTVAVLAGLPVPRYATGEAIASILATSASDGLAASYKERSTAVAAFAQLIREPTGQMVFASWPPDVHGETVSAFLASARADRLDYDRRLRASGLAAWILGAAALGLLIIGLLSWRALVAGLAGAAGYYAIYNALFFGTPGNLWSLSAFNSEDLIDAWMNTRLIEAALAGLAAALVAGLVYPLLRKQPKGPRGSYLPGWLGLGPLAVLVTQVTLALQVAWFTWWWGVNPTWSLPDFKWAFKFDLDLIQMTALGASLLLAPLVTYLVGRYHPKVRKRTAERA